MFLPISLRAAQFLQSRKMNIKQLQSGITDSSHSSFPGEAELLPAIRGRQTSLQMRMYSQPSCFQTRVPGTPVRFLCIRDSYTEMKREWHPQTGWNPMEIQIAPGNHLLRLCSSAGDNLMSDTYTRGKKGRRCTAF